MEGRIILYRFDGKCGMIFAETAAENERVAYLVGHHHRPEQINGIDYQILIEADYIVNASENGYSQQAIRSFMEHTMKTVFGV